jgi:HEAT repeat protein
MKEFFAALVLCIAAYGPMYAGENERPRALTTAKLEQIEESLINAFQSDVPGLQTSAATTLVQVRRRFPNYSWSNSVIPLMRIVNDEKSDSEARIAAALALYDLQTDRGDYSIVQNARFTSDPRVRRICTLLIANRRPQEITP